MAPSRNQSAELDALDQTYREGGLRAMALPCVHYDPSGCPHPGCDQYFTWIEFKQCPTPLVRSWWQGTGFVGRCPSCGGWIRFTTLRMEPLTDEQADSLPHLPDHWHAIAQLA